MSSRTLFPSCGRCRLLCCCWRSEPCRWRKHWWEKNYPWVTLILGLLGSTYYLAGPGAFARWLESMEEYASFIVLLASLFVVSGGISITVTRKATPLANGILLLLGAVAANFFGTTGAAMLLIRPYVRMNQKHLKPYHVVFFIFIVANVGGCLTPIGDPPLFLGYLMGVPFWWCLANLYGIWMLAIAWLLVVFLVIDILDHRQEKRHHAHDAGPAVRILGIHNFLFILVIVAAVLQPSVFSLLHEKFNLALIARYALSREILMVAAGVASWFLTRPAIRAAQRVYLRADSRGRDPLRRHFRRHGAGDSVHAGQRRRAADQNARAVLFFRRRPFVIARQRADV